MRAALIRGAALLLVRHSIRQADLDEIVVKDGSVPEIGLPLRRRLVRVCSVRGVLAPPNRRRPYDALPDRFLDSRHRRERASIVLYQHASAGGNRSLLGIPWVEHAFRVARG